MIRDRKCTLLIMLVIVVVIGGVFGFYLAKSGWEDKLGYGIKNIDWIMISCIILMTLILLFQILYFIFNKKKAGEKIFTLHTYNYKTQVKLFIFELIILLFEVALYIYSPSIHAMCVVGMIFILVILMTLTVYFMNGVHENGLIYVGKFQSWEKIMTYDWESDKLLTFKVKSKRKGCIELKYYIKNNGFEEIESYLQESKSVIKGI
jgi:hypothetical protein